MHRVFYAAMLMILCQSASAQWMTDWQQRLTNTTPTRALVTNLLAAVNERALATFTGTTTNGVESFAAGPISLVTTNVQYQYTNMYVCGVVTSITATTTNLLTNYCPTIVTNTFTNQVGYVPEEAMIEAIDSKIISLIPYFIAHTNASGGTYDSWYSANTNVYVPAWSNMSIFAAAGVGRVVTQDLSARFTSMPSRPIKAMLGMVMNSTSGFAFVKGWSLNRGSVSEFAEYSNDFPVVNVYQDGTNPASASLTVSLYGTAVGSYGTDYYTNIVSNVTESVSASVGETATTNRWLSITNITVSGTSTNVAEIQVYHSSTQAIYATSAFRSSLWYRESMLERYDVVNLMQQSYPSIFYEQKITASARTNDNDTCYTNSPPSLPAYSGIPSGGITITTNLFDSFDQYIQRGSYVGGWMREAQSPTNVPQYQANSRFKGAELEFAGGPTSSDPSYAIETLDGVVAISSQLTATVDFYVLPTNYYINSDWVNELPDPYPTNDFFVYASSDSSGYSGYTSTNYISSNTYASALWSANTESVYATYLSGLVSNLVNAPGTSYGTPRAPCLNPAIPASPVRYEYRAVHDYTWIPTPVIKWGFAYIDSP